MLTAVFIDDTNTRANYSSMPAFHDQPNVCNADLLPHFGDIGTGGVGNVQFVMLRWGYVYPVVILREKTPEARNVYTDSMVAVKAGFGRTMCHLAGVFGVSRQTLYNWLKGENPKEQHRGKLMELAAAARVLTKQGFKPTAQSLQRTIAQGKTFIELIGQGADGQQTAEQLIRIERRGIAAQARLNALLGDRAPLRPEISDMGRPAFKENA